MKRNKALFILLTGVILAGTGCKKFLDVNKDPNDPLTVPESLILTPVEITTGTQVVGGYNGSTVAYWMQQLSQNQPSPNVESYLILPVDVDNTWSFYLYPNTFQSLLKLIQQAEPAGHSQYVAVGKALFAYNLAIATDCWNAIPYSQGFQPATNPHPKYDNQEAIYGSIQNLLDSALYYIAQPPAAKAFAPGTDDFIYGGNMSAWKKFIYMMKARFYLRLTNAPGRTAAKQADSALTALQNAFSSNADNASVSYSGTAQAENPWYINTNSGAGGVVMAKSFIDSLISRQDPRLPILADTNNKGTYAGRASGSNQAPDPTAFSNLNTFYGGNLALNQANTAGAAAPLFLATYSEALFIKAEATFIKSGAAAAQPIYDSAIASHMNLLGVAQADKMKYINSRPLLTTSNALQQIISEKYVADFLSIETWNDWRRTGYPVLTLAQNAYTNYIPRRWPYSNTEVLANPQPEQSGVTTASHVWWDTTP